MKKIYFAADAHFGAGTMKNPLEYERRFVRWLDSIKPTAEALYLLGDMIDFWFEYKTVVPRGYTRFFGKLADLVDSGVDVHWFVGNHDMWISDYLSTELGVKIHRQTLTTTLRGRTFLLSHGDQYGDPKDYKYRILRKLFHSNLCRRALAVVHPRWTIAMAHRWSKQSRKRGGCCSQYLGEGREHLVLFAKRHLLTAHVDFFVFGHRHIPLDLRLPGDSRIVILGDWIEHFTFGVLDNAGFSLEYFEETRH